MVNLETQKLNLDKTRRSAAIRRLKIYIIQLMKANKLIDRMLSEFSIDKISKIEEKVNNFNEWLCKLNNDSRNDHLFYLALQIPYIKVRLKTIFDAFAILHTRFNELKAGLRQSKITESDVSENKFNEVLVKKVQEMLDDDSLTNPSSYEIIKAIIMGFYQSDPYIIRKAIGEFSQGHENPATRTQTFSLFFKDSGFIPQTQYEKRKAIVDKMLNEYKQNLDSTENQNSANEELTEEENITLEEELAALTVNENEGVVEEVVTPLRPPMGN